MVYTGKPSRGCSVCRKRHIKCDEAEPSCSFCTRRNIPCPGYKSQFDVAWKDQNLVAERSVQRRKNAIKGKDLHHDVGQQMAKLKSSTPFFSMPQNLESYALSFFFSNYLLLPCDPEVGRGFLDYVHPIWVQAHLESSLRPAVLAVASCMLEAWSRITPGQSLSFSQLHYAKAVSAMRKIMQKSDGIGDDLIMTALMLDFYEGIQTFCKLQANHSPHVSGTMAMIAQRRHHVKAKATQQVLLGARRQILGRALRDRQYMRLDLIDIDQPIARTAGSRLDDLNVEVANLQAMVTQIEDYRLVKDDILLDILRRATELDHQLSNWKTEVPKDWGPMRVSGPECIASSVREAGLYRGHCSIYKSIHIANKFNEYCCSRVRLQLITFSCLKEFDSRNLASTAVIASDMIQELVDMVCDSVPYHLGDRQHSYRIDDRTAQFPHLVDTPVSDEHYASTSAYAGFTLVARLFELMTPDLPLREGQRQWMGGQIARIGRIHTI